MSINLCSKFDKFTDHWSPKVIAEMYKDITKFIPILVLLGAF